MSKSKSKLGHNPLTPRGVGALFADSAQPQPAPTALATDVIHSPVAKTVHPTRRFDVKSVSHLVNKVTTPSTTDAALERHTFYLSEAQTQKVKLYALLHRMQISEVMRMLIDDHLKIQP